MVYILSSRRPKAPASMSADAALARIDAVG
jgi:hypothetical protein